MTPVGALAKAVEIGKKLKEIEHCIWLMSYRDAEATPSQWADRIRRAAQQIVKDADHLIRALKEAEDKRQSEGKARKDSSSR